VTPDPRELAERALRRPTKTGVIVSDYEAAALARELLSALDERDRLAEEVAAFRAEYRALGIGTERPPEEVFAAFRKLHGLASMEGDK
jgi:chorismate mutase